MNALRTRLLHMALRAGKPGAAVAGQADLARAVGLRAVRLQARQRSEARHLPDPLDALYRTLWQEAADDLGVAVEEVGDGFLRVGGALVWRQLVPLDSPVTLRLAADKVLTHRLLAEAGLPVPAHVVGDGDLAAARAFVADRGGPCVVKPAFGTDRGAGVTTGVRTPADLARAAVRAARWDGRVVVEEQVPGDVHRVLVLNGRVVDVVRRSPPGVVGDGTSSVAELVAAENRLRLDDWGRRAAVLLDLDLDAVLHLGATGRTVHWVPSAGERVTVKPIVNQNRADENARVVDAVSPDLVDEAVQAASTVGLRLAGVDVVTPDVGCGLRDAGGVVLEVNGTPGFNLHRLVADPAGAARVTTDVLRVVLGRSD